MSWLFEGQKQFRWENKSYCKYVNAMIQPLKESFTNYNKQFG